MILFDVRIVREVIGKIVLCIVVFEGDILFDVVYKDLIKGGL